MSHIDGAAAHRERVRLGAMNRVELLALCLESTLPNLERDCLSLGMSKKRVSLMRKGILELMVQISRGMERERAKAREQG